MALLLGKDPAEVIAEVKAETEKSEKRRVFCRDILSRAKQAAKLGTLALIFTASMGGIASDREGAFLGEGTSHNAHYVKHCLRSIGRCSCRCHLPK